MKAKLDEFERERWLKEVLVWVVLAVGLLTWFGSIYWYRYDGERTHEILDGQVLRISYVESEVPVYVLEIDVDGKAIFIRENFPPEVVAGDRVKVRKTSTNSGGKNVYFRLRKPRA